MTFLDILIFLGVLFLFLLIWKAIKAYQKANKKFIKMQQDLKSKFKKTSNTE